MNFSQLTDSDLIEKLDKGAVIAQLESSEGWQLVQEACKRKVKQIEMALKKIDPSNMVAIIELQTRAEVYGEDFILGLIRSIRQEAELAFEEAKEREIIEKP